MSAVYLPNNLMQKNTGRVNQKPKFSLDEIDSFLSWLAWPNIVATIQKITKSIPKYCSCKQDIQRA